MLSTPRRWSGPPASGRWSTADRAPEAACGPGRLLRWRRGRNLRQPPPNSGRSSQASQPWPEPLPPAALAGSDAAISRGMDHDSGEKVPDRRTAPDSPTGTCRRHHRTPHLHRRPLLPNITAGGTPGHHHRVPAADLAPGHRRDAVGSAQRATSRASLAFSRRMGECGHRHGPILPGELTQCDLWFPPVDVPLGYRQVGRPPVLVMVRNTLVNIGPELTNALPLLRPSWTRLSVTRRHNDVPIRLVQGVFVEEAAC
jgi:hypothetical protein